MYFIYNVLSKVLQYRSPVAFLLSAVTSLQGLSFNSLMRKNSDQNIKIKVD